MKPRAGNELRASVVVFFGGKSFQSEVTFKAFRGNKGDKSEKRFKSDRFFGWQWILRA